MMEHSCMYVCCSMYVECGYNGNSDCCNFAIAVGVLGFLLCLVFLVKDVLYVIVDYSDNIVVSWYVHYTWWIYSFRNNIMEYKVLHM